MIIEEIVKYNEEFVARRGYEQYVTSKYPDKKLAILSCMDTRLTELLPAALGLKNGDAKIIKNAGGLVISPFDSAMRSLLVAIYELGVEEIMVVAHSKCGACHMNGAEMKRLMLERGIHQDVIDTILRAHPKRIVYVSCNPSTQARDLQALDVAYKVMAVQPVDMFPHTPHVENVVLLEEKP